MKRVMPAFYIQESLFCLTSLFKIRLFAGIIMMISLSGAFGLSSAAGDQPDRAEIEILRLRAPQSGIAVWLVENHANDLVVAQLFFEGGALFDPDNLPGLANLTSYLLGEGAGKLDSVAFRTALDKSAVSLDFQASPRSFSVDLAALAEDFHQGMKLLGLALTAPRFDADPLARVKSQIATHIQDLRSDPHAVASDVMRVALYGEDGPWVSPIEGTQESLEQINLGNLRTFVRNQFTRDQLTVAVVGDIEPEVLLKLIDSSLSDLPQTSQHSPRPPPSPLHKKQIVLAPFPGRQGVIFFAHAGMTRQDPDFYAAKLVVHALGGGGLNSRLHHAIREQQGLTYGVGVAMIASSKNPVLFGSASSENKNLPDLIHIVRDTWSDFSENGLSQQEFDDAKAHIIGSLPFDLSSSLGIANLLIRMQRYHLGHDYLERRANLFEAVTFDDAQAVAKRLINPEALAFGVAAEKEAVKADMIYSPSSVP